MEANWDQKIKLALWFAVRGDAKYLSHRDTMLVWQRTLVRADIPVRYSQGFNPHIRLSLPLPRSVGTASELELAVVLLSRPCTPDQACRKLDGQLPRDIELRGAQTIERQKTCRPESVQYRLTLAPTADLAPLRNLLDRFQQADQWLILRQARKRLAVKSLDLRREIQTLELQGRTLYITIQLGLPGTVRIEELRSFLLLDAPDQIEEITRLQTTYTDGPDLPLLGSGSPCS